jgi:hypothetical protein
MAKKSLGKMAKAYMRRNVDTANESVAVGTTMTITLATIPPASTAELPVSFFISQMDLTKVDVYILIAAWGKMAKYHALVLNNIQT